MHKDERICAESNPGLWLALGPSALGRVLVWLAGDATYAMALDPFGATPPFTLLRVDGSIEGAWLGNVMVSLNPGDAAPAAPVGGISVVDGALFITCLVDGQPSQVPLDCQPGQGAADDGDYGSWRAHLEYAPDLFAEVFEAECAPLISDAHASPASEATIH